MLNANFSADEYLYAISVSAICFSTEPVWRLIYYQTESYNNFLDYLAGANSTYFLKQQSVIFVSIITK